MADTILKANRAALVDYDGQTITVRPTTTVREGHPLALAYPGLFDPIKVDYDLDESPAGDHEAAAVDLEKSTETADATPTAAPAAKPARGGKATETR